MATNPWDYAATHGQSMEPNGVNEMKIFIGLGDELPDGIVTEEGTFCLFIDPAASPVQTQTRGSAITEYEDFLRPPNSGLSCQDHPFLNMTRRHRCDWYGNAKLFSTTFDLMVAASFYADGNTFSTVRRGEDGKYKILLADPGYHPMSGRLPTGVRNAERWTLLAILSSVFFYAVEYSRAGFVEGQSRIFPHLYSVYSTHCAAPALLIGYNRIYMNCDGTVADAFYNYADYRRTIAYRMMDVASSLQRELGVRNNDPLECVTALFRWFGLAPRNISSLVV